MTRGRVCIDYSACPAVEGEPTLDVYIWWNIYFIYPLVGQVPNAAAIRQTPRLPGVLKCECCHEIHHLVTQCTVPDCCDCRCAGVFTARPTLRCSSR
jgi:hypothetical protein